MPIAQSIVLEKLYQWRLSSDLVALHTGRVQGNPKYGLQYSAQPFGFAVTRTGSSSPALFNTAGNRFVFKVWPAPLQSELLLFSICPCAAIIPRVIDL